MISISHWGLHRGGYHVAVEIRPGAGQAMFVQTDEDGRPVNPPWNPPGSADLNDVPRAEE